MPFSSTFLELSNYILDCDLCKLLAMAFEFAMAFAALLVEDQYFLAFYQRSDHFANNFCASNCRRAHVDFAVVVYE